LLTLFWPPSLLPSAVAAAATNANVSTAAAVNAIADASVFTIASHCFCHYRHHAVSACATAITTDVSAAVAATFWVIVIQPFVAGTVSPTPLPKPPSTSPPPPVVY
jgi:hypothetical protein